jgi:hypothetical protein
MTRAKRLSAAGLLLLVVGAVVWLHGSDVPPVAEREPPGQPAKASSPVGPEAPGTTAGSDRDGEAAAPPARGDEPPSAAPDAAGLMNSQLKDIADAYRHNSRFPSYSRPLAASDWDLLNPRAFVPRETPLAGYPDVAASIEVDRYVVDVNRPLSVRVRVSSPTRVVSAASLSLLSARGPGGSVALAEQAAVSGGQVFSGVVPASLLLSLGEGDVALLAALSVMGDEPVTVSAQLKLYLPDARLTYLGAPYVDGANLVIPAHFEVTTRGYYRVRANLFEQEGERPVAHINAAFMLDPPQATGLLRVHAETLRAMQAPGPYLLTDIDITRSPARPGDSTGYGSSAQPSWPVPGFNLGSYSDEPYVDESVRQRQEFLDRLSGEAP